MTPQDTELLRARLLGETARVQWSELLTFFARGQLIRVDAKLDLIDIAAHIAGDDLHAIESLTATGKIAPLDDSTATDWQQRQPVLWAVVLAPWILVQERGH